MSKAYPSNLSHAQYEFLSEMIPEPKPGGRKREADMLSVLNAIFYVLVEGVRWRSLPGDFPAWQTVYRHKVILGNGHFALVLGLGGKLLTLR
ncbi:transposase [Nostoc sp.]|uniref:transposase n=1 Tax=Nostoc sp. TaxID=1180 RepID=UPI00359383F4